MPRLDKNTFDRHYDKLILRGDFFEEDGYYVRERPRYYRTLQYVLEQIEDTADLAALEVLEIGGGQIALLLNGMFGCKCVIADVNPEYGDSLVRHGHEFRVCDLLHDDLPDRGRFDVVVMCEVIEHLPVPPYKILPKLAQWMKPGGLLFLTTPNLYRLRNVLRLALGMRVFDTFFLPERGQPIGHPLEYSAEHLAWQLERAGFPAPSIRYRQLALTGASLRARIARWMFAPLLFREKFRDSLVASVRNPA